MVMQSGITAVWERIPLTAQNLDLKSSALGMLSLNYTMQNQRCCTIRQDSHGQDVIYPLYYYLLEKGMIISVVFWLFSFVPIEAGLRWSTFFERT